MKIKLPPNQFKSIINAGMLMKNKDPFVNPLPIIFTPEGMVITSKFSNAMGFWMNIDKTGFTEYEVEKEEVVSVPHIFVERLNWGFKDKEISLSTKKGTLHLDGKYDHYDKEMPILEPITTPFEMTTTEYGLTPANYDFKNSKLLTPNDPRPKKIEFLSAVQLDAKTLEFPVSKHYIFRFEKGTLSVQIPSEGNFVRTFKDIKKIAEGNITVKVDGSFYEREVANLDGEITLIIDDNRLMFFEKGEHHQKTYMLGTKILKSEREKN